MIERELLMDFRAEIRKIAREEVKKAIEEHDRTTDKRTETNASDLINRQAALEHLKKRLLETAINNTGAMVPCDSVFEDTAKNRIGPWLNEVPSASPDPHWIPCGERLPEDDVEVLVTDDAGGVQWLGVDKMLSYEDGSGRFWLVSQNPSAWMPLPAPYCSEGEKK